MDRDEIAGVLGAYDLGRIQTVEPFDFPFRPWRVVTDRGCYVIRECLLHGALQSVTFEHGLAAWLAGRGLPVSRALRTRKGETWVERGGRFFAVYNYLPGAPFTPGSARQAESVGACLARWHEVASEYQGAREKRPPDGFRTAQHDMDVLRSRWPEQPEITWLLGEFQAADEAMSGRAPDQALLHNDLQPGNCVFDGAEVCGIFDTDCCFWGPRLHDVANSLLWFSFVETGQEGIAEHEDRMDVDCARALFAGYQSVCPLPGGDMDMLPDALRWRVRRWALFDTLDAHPAGHWSDWEWTHSARQIDLVDRACNQILTR